MPELPEVETIKLGLSRKIIGLKIKKIQILNKNSFQGNPRNILNKKISILFRKAKILGIEIGKYVLLIHLKMSGQLIYQDKNRFIGGHPTPDMHGNLPNRSTRVIFEFNSGAKLYFNDQRKFGWIKLVKSDELKVQKFLQQLGPEPLEKGFTWKILKQNLLKHQSLPIKVALLDQTVVSGIGNIYASEALFNASLHPKIKVKDLSNSQIKKLYQGIIKSLTNGIKYGGSSKAHFVDPEGKKGYYLDYAYVYFKAGRKCQNCSSIIEKFQLAGRGTYYCPSCQYFDSSSTSLTVNTQD